MEEMQPLVGTETRSRRTRTGQPGSGFATIHEEDEDGDDERLPGQNMSGALPRSSGESEGLVNPTALSSPPSVDQDNALERSNSCPGDSGANVQITRRSTLPLGATASNSSPPIPRTGNGRAFPPVRVVSETRMRKGKRQASRRGHGTTNQSEPTAATSDAGYRSASSGSDYSRELPPDEKISRAASRTANEYFAEYSALAAEENPRQANAELQPSQVDTSSLAGESSSSNSIQTESGFTVADVWMDRVALRASAPEIKFTRPSTESREIDEAEISDHHLHPGPFLPHTGRSGRGWTDVGR